MGLDVTAYSQIKHRPKAQFDSDGCLKNQSLIQLHVNSDYPDRAKDIVDGGAYSYVDCIRIRCGAYSRYNRWRDDLAKMAGWPEGSYNQWGRDWPSYAASAWSATEGPFWELISFSDCEGVLGTATCKKLLVDFEAHKDAALKDGDEAFSFGKYYGEWLAAFQLAAHDGCIAFH